MAVNNIELVYKFHKQLYLCIRTIPEPGDEETHVPYDMCHFSVLDVPHMHLASSRKEIHKVHIEVSLMHITIGVLCIDQVTVRCCHNETLQSVQGKLVTQP